MIQFQGLYVFITLILSLFILYALFREKQCKYGPYPPGPVPKFIIGNALDVPLKKAWKKYMEWGKQFNSDIIYLSALGTQIVILNSMEDITELFEKQSVNYSDRPSLKFYDLIGFSRITACLSYGPTLKIHRRLMDEFLKKDAVLDSYGHIFVGKVHFLLEQLLHKPDLFREHIAELNVSVTMTTAFGYDITPGVKDRFVKPVEFVTNTVADLAIPGQTFLIIFGFLCDIPPWIPGASTQRLCAAVKEAVKLSKEGPFQYVKQKMSAGTSKDCVLATALARNPDDISFVDDENLLKEMMFTFYIAGVETTKVSMLNFMLAMTLHPHAQKKAQAEIDSVVGAHRLPCYEDRASLPYVEALYREVYRWRPVLPTALPRTTTRDNVYKGYWIPKGAIILPNVWALTRDEDRYPDSESFKPERFFNTDGTLNDDTISYVFGFGRRICSGRYMADKVVWLMIVTVLATFNISKSRDNETGREIDVDPDAYTNGAISNPLPFKCAIVHRSEQAEVLIQNAAGVAWKDLMG